MKKWFRRVAIGALAGLLLFVGITFSRLQLAKFQLARNQQALSAAVPVEIGETTTLEILPLYEKAAQPGLQSGHGVSYLIRTDSGTILFDLGNNPEAASPSPLERNMASLGVSMEDVDAIVMSHRHPDHVGGQHWWTRQTFSLDGSSQPSLGSLPVYVPEKMSYPGGSLTLAEKPVQLVNGVATTGLITYAQPFPIWLAMPTGDEQALAVNLSGQGLVLITGCGHMGLGALLERAEKVFDVPVVGVVGGLHYGNADIASLQTEIEMIRALNPIVVSLSPHDSGPAVLEGFENQFPQAYARIRVGHPIHLPVGLATP